jgi:hypothetical protein
MAKPSFEDEPSFGGFHGAIAEVWLLGEICSVCVRGVYMDDLTPLLSTMLRVQYKQSRTFVRWTVSGFVTGSDCFPGGLPAQGE